MEVNNKNDYSYTVESYSWITNIDKSILKLNTVLRNYGYQFIEVSLEELENKFFRLFSLPANYQSEIQVIINRFDKEVKWNGTGKLKDAIEKVRTEKLEQGLKKEEIESTISQEFYDLLMYNIQGGRNILKSHGVIFLKRVADIKRVLKNNRFTANEEIEVAGEMQKFEKHLLQCMRLYRNGDVACRSSFQISADNRSITSRFISSPFILGNRQFIIDDDDIEPFAELLKQSFIGNKLSELTLQTFEYAYLNPDAKSRFLNFMICLESLFNRNGIEISHTISRHTSIILSNNKSEFEANYRSMKNLYKCRSEIIHGLPVKFNLLQKTEDLQNIVRKSIKYCLNINLDIDQLFADLNAKGFSS